MSESTSRMLINYVPGEECRVAVVENGNLEELHGERAGSISRVGNIYTGVVTNVEPAIQAAFIEFGVEAHGFLHVTDVHPRYFPGEDDDTTERVGKKTPRRERPPIQKCFRRGDEVTVQVLKEGVGTKGPTLTSYLSIPGRFLVMMPQMDRVGVSRKVEDEELRRKMRAILDQLDLPEGFGFILRTAGMERTKLELKRDLAYLMRLWKDMESRLAGGEKTRLLYSESDLLVRALRDMVGPEIGEVVIDNEQALKRAARFLKIVAPRSRVKLLQYTGNTPLFHAFGVEPQIARIHSREVPLPSGGRLVFDEAEALVAIDVNSGKMRDARDAETNAYRTNVEAVEEICRQLKLRDVGGIIINDLIDMRHASHRKDIEQRFRDRLKRDRSRTTTLAISEFGILEMTRQRMRGSHESVHFTECPTCHGRGLVQRPDSVAADAMRNLAALLDHDRVSRVEMVVSPRVASELLSGRRQTLGRLERRAGKHVDVRVSETVPVDRVSFYAYEATGADIEIDKLPEPRTPGGLVPWDFADKDDQAGWAADMLDETPVTPEPEVEEVEPEVASHPIEFDDEGPITPVDAGAASAAGGPPGPDGPGGEEGQGGRRRRRRRRGGRGRGRGGDGRSGDPQTTGAGGAREGAGPPPMGDAPPVDHGGPRGPTDATDQGHAFDGPVTDEGGGSAPMSPGGDGQHGQGQPAQGPPGEPGEGGRRRRRRRRRRGRGRGGQGGEDSGGQPPTAGEGAPPVHGETPDGTPIMDQPPPPLDEGPRGDSWDLEPAQVVVVQPDRAPPRGDRPGVETADGAPPLAPVGPDGQDDSRGGRRRRRR
ncbi:MAG: ribonuclease E/G, partial [Phycisphaerales bacterium]